MLVFGHFFLDLCIDFLCVPVCGWGASRQGVLGMNVATIKSVDDRGMPGDSKKLCCTHGGFCIAQALRVQC